MGEGCPISGMKIGRPQHKVVFHELLKISFNLINTIKPRQQ